MLILPLFSAFLGGAAAAAIADKAPVLCNATPPESLVALGAPKLSGLASRQTPTINIDVWFHVIHKDNTVAGGNVPQTTLDAQFTILQNTVSSLGVNLTLKNITRTLDPVWYVDNLNSYSTPGGPHALRQGDYKTLNVYFNAGTPGGAASFPVPTPSANIIALDFVQVHHETLPGGAGVPPFMALGWNQGKTLPHEVGHWLSLYHPDHGPCDPDLVNGGDFVYDTPPSAYSIAACPDAGPEYYEPFWDDDTCPDLPGLDPHDNPMGRFWDRCRLDYFTPGQRERVHAMWSLTRG